MKTPKTINFEPFAFPFRMSFAVFHHEDMLIHFKFDIVILISSFGSAIA